MSYIFNYKGYTACGDINEKTNVVKGRVIDIDDSIPFEGESIGQFEKVFRNSIDSYLEFCEEINKQPAKPTNNNIMNKPTFLQLMESEVNMTDSIRDYLDLISNLDITKVVTRSYSIDGYSPANLHFCLGIYKSFYEDKLTRIMLNSRTSIDLCVKHGFDKLVIKWAKKLGYSESDINVNSRVLLGTSTKMMFSYPSFPSTTELKSEPSSDNAKAGVKSDLILFDTDYSEETMCEISKFSKKQCFRQWGVIKPYEVGSYDFRFVYDNDKYVCHKTGQLLSEFLTSDHFNNVTVVID